MERKRFASTHYVIIASCCAFWALSMGSAWPQAAPTKNISLSLNQAPIRQALTQLFQQVGLNYSLDSSVQGMVTASLKDVAFPVALNSLLRANRPQLTYVVRDGVYEIHPRPGSQASAYRSTQSEKRSATPSKATTTLRIPLNYDNAALLMQYALGGGTEIPPTVPGQTRGNSSGRGRPQGNGRYGRNNASPRTVPMR